MNISISDVKKVYSAISSCAKSCVDSNAYGQGLDFIRSASRVAYLFNWIYTDAKLESYLRVISKKIIKVQDFVPVQGRVVFYDSFGLDNRGLTLQYIHALMSANINFLYIFENENKKKSSLIRSELESYDKCEIFSVEQALPAEEKIISTYDRIVRFQPDTLLMHISPWAVEAVTVFYALSNVTKYQINLTDHAFWLGAECLDFSIEFRSYGCTVSTEKRNLKKSQLLVNPYYPVNLDAEFKGFPLDTASNLVIFSGASFYKIYGRNSRFFHLVKRLLNNHPNAIILFAGDGEGEELQKFIKNNNLENRFILIGNRDDVGEVFKRCDIYLATYPITGGLMAQLAAYYSKPILAYTSPDIRCNYVEGIIGHNYNLNITQETEAEFFKESRMLIESKSLRLSRGVDNKGALITSEEFNKNLVKCICENKSPFAIAYEEINYAAFTGIYLEVENKYQYPFKRLFIKDLGLRAYLYYPVLAIKVTFFIMGAELKSRLRKWWYRE